MCTRGGRGAATSREWTSTRTSLSRLARRAAPPVSRSLLPSTVAAALSHPRPSPPPPSPQPLAAVAHSAVRPFRSMTKMPTWVTTTTTSSATRGACHPAHLRRDKLVSEPRGTRVSRLSGDTEAGVHKLKLYSGAYLTENYYNAIVEQMAKGEEGLAGGTARSIPFFMNDPEETPSTADPQHGWIYLEAIKPSSAPARHDHFSRGTLSVGHLRLHQARVRQLWRRLLEGLRTHGLLPGVLRGGWRLLSRWLRGRWLPPCRERHRLRRHALLHTHPA